jgi:DNA-directed RNA polymerase
VAASLKKSTSEHHSRAVVRHVLRKKGESLAWSQEMHFQVGAALLECLLAGTGHVSKVRTGKMRNTKIHLRLSDELVDALAYGVDREVLHAPFSAPMIVPPRPWSSTSDGGYDAVGMSLMKRYAEGQEESMVDMPEVYAAMNKLQDTPWRINDDLLQVLRTTWRGGHQVGKLPAQENMPTPAKTWGEDETPDAEVLTAWKRKAAKVHEENARLVSKRLAVASAISQAEMNQAEPDLYFVYTMDWRGRVYPSGSDLTPQSADFGRALLEFAEGKPIGDAGFYWLAVHLANTFGHDKVSNDDRVK